jgi:YesN/AraC family two-component response regulator
VGFALWNTSVRIDVACKLLTATNRKIHDIASTVGYGDITTFERVFRKITGVCPSEYRVERASRNTQDADNSSRNAETFGDPVE